MNNHFKNTEVGTIPRDWEVYSIGEVATVIRGASPRPKGDSRYYGGEVPRLMVEDVTRDGKYVTPSVDYLTEEGAKRSRPCSKGTLTLVCSGEVGRPSFLAVDACIHDGFLALTQLRSDVEKEFLYYLFEHQDSRFEESATHGGVFTNLTTSILRDHKIPLPPTEEQRAIAETLTEIDELIASLDALIEKKRGVKKGAMQRLLNREGRLPGFDGDWKVKSLGEIGSFSKGSGIRRNELVEDGVPCVRYGEIYTHHEDKIEEFVSYVPRHIAEQAERLKKGDLLFTGSGETKEEIGMCAAYLKKKEAYAGGDLIILRPDSECSEFLGYALNAADAVNQKASMAQGDAVVHIRPRDLAQVTVSLPPLEEQQAIAEVLSDIDAEIAALENRRDKVKAVKKGMMQELLTGKTRLIKEPASAPLHS